MLVAQDKPGSEAALADLKDLYFGTLPPEFQGRLGYWNYRAGNYSAAFDGLTQAVRQRPGAGEFSTQLGWALIERRNFEDALARFNVAKRSSPMRSQTETVGPRSIAEPHMGSAVAFWLARQKDEAINEFSLAVDAQPEWLNANWTGALYTPTVTKAVAEMQAEKEKRRAQQRRAQASMR